MDVRQKKKQLLNLLKRSVDNEKLETRELLEVQLKGVKNFEKYQIEVTSKDEKAGCVKLNGEEDDEEEYENLMLIFICS